MTGESPRRRQQKQARTPADVAFKAIVVQLVADAKEAGVPLRDLCKEVGVSHANISRWQNQPAPISLRLVAGLQAALQRRVEGQVPTPA